MARAKDMDGQPQEANGLETRNLRPADPTTLMQDNPAALIVNKESYRLMASKFSPGRFDAPQVARVVTYSAEGEEVIKDFIVDGMTRTKYVYDNRARIEQENPGFVFTVNDITQDVIGNSDVVPASEKKDGQDALTLVQYMRAVIPPTVEHTKIAPDRIAAHLINGWRSMVGDQIAERYSAVAALNLLTHPNTNIATDQALQRELQKQLNRMAGETEEERDRLQDALVQMAQIIRQSKINKPEVAKAAYVLVASGSEVIGGEKETARQIYGMLHSPNVEQKLQRAYPGAGIGEQSERELAREELGARIGRFFRNNKDERNISELMGTFNSAFQDSDLRLDQLNDVLTSEKPVQQYTELRSEINRDKLEDKYRLQLQRLNRRELSDAEVRLLNNLGFKRYLVDSEIPGLVRAISTAQDEVAKARIQVAKFADETEREELASAGVRLEVFDQVLEEIAEVESQILSATNPRTVTVKAQELNGILTDINRRVNHQRSSHAVGLEIDRASGTKFAEGLGGPQARQSAINYVLGKFSNTIDGRNINEARRMIGQLVGLDPDLFNKVISGDIRLVVALDEQRKRIRRASADVVEVLVRPDAVVQSTVTTEEARMAEPAVTMPQMPLAEALKPVGEPPATEETVVFAEQDIDEVRLGRNREKLGRLLEEMGERLPEIDLESSELTPEERRKLQDLIDRLGMLAFGRDGTSLIMTEVYPAMLAKERARQEARVAGEIADNHDLTSTSR